MRRASDPSRDSGENRPLVTGLIGLGHPGQTLLGLAPTAKVEVKWLCDHDPQLLERIGRHRPFARSTGVDFLLDDDELEAILIATSAPAQFELASRALTAGKHVFLVEPAVMPAAGLAKLARTSAKEELVLACGSTNLYSSPVRAIKTMLDEQKIGELLFASSTWPEADAAGSNTSRDHFAMLLHWLGERAQTVRATAPEPGSADSGGVTVLTLAFPSGVVANVELEQAGSTPGRTVLVGTERMAVYDEADEAISTLDHGIVHKANDEVADYKISYPIANSIPAAPAEANPLRLALEDFGAAVRGGGEVVASGRLAKDATRIIEAAEESLRRGGVEVPVGVRRRLLRAQPTRRAVHR
jgi:predicted dehydrogenase